MAPRLKERSAGKVIAIISINIVVQIFILPLILFSQVTNGWGCLGAPKYKLTFQNHLADDDPTYDMNKNKMKIVCIDITDWKRIITVGRWGGRYREVYPNPEDSFSFCGGWALDPLIDCYVWLNGTKNEEFDFLAFSFGYDCKKVNHCTWQIRRNHALIFSLKENSFVPPPSYLPKPVPKIRYL